MLRIAVCDDEIIEVKKINNTLERYFSKKNIEIKIYTYSDGKELINSKLNFDLVFLDIDMKDLDGLETAKIIRSYDMDVSIVYITNYAEHSMKAFKVHAFEFIKKPYKEEDIYNVLGDFLRLPQKTNDKTIKLEINDVICLYKIEDINFIYIDKDKKINVNSRIGEFEIKEKSLNNIMKRLDEKQFYKSHRSYIVNLRQIFTINNYDIIMLNNEFCPLAQDKKAEFMRKLNDFWQY